MSVPTHSPRGETRLPRGVPLGYGLGSVATGSFSTVPGLMLLPYLTDEIGIAAALASFVVFIPKAWDVIANPIAGRLSDRTTSRIGPRRPYVLWGGVGLAISFALIFAAPTSVSPIVSTAWVAIAFVLSSTAYAFFQVPYFSMSAEITSSPHERTRLMGWRVAVVSLAILVSGSLAPAIQGAIGGSDGYRAMGAFVGGLILLGALGTFFGTRRAPVGAKHPGPGRLRDQLRIIAANRRFRLTLMSFMIQAIATSTSLAAIAYISRWILAGDPAASTMLFICVIGPALLVTPLWTAAGSRFGKMAGWIAATIIWFLTALLFVATASVSSVLVYGIAALTGIGFAGLQIFPQALLPDLAAEDAERTGENRSGMYIGVWTAGETLGLALGPGLYGLVLAAGAYRSGGLIDQPPSALTAIVLGFSIVPAALMAASLIPLGRLRSSAGRLSPMGAEAGADV